VFSGLLVLARFFRNAILFAHMELHVLNLGAGVQSTTLYLLSLQGRIQKFDAAIFADTQDEPGAEERRRGLPDPPNSVYAHLDWLDTVGGAPILRRTRGCISADLMRVENSTGGRFTTIPAFTAAYEGEKNYGQTRRQCTKEYKVEVIERTVRRELLGLAPGRAIPRTGVIVYQYIGISWDERSRAFDIQRRFCDKHGKERPNWKVRFLLLEMNGANKPGWTRTDCERYLELNCPHKVYPSSCIHCPYHDDDEWRTILAMGASGERLIQIDTALRIPGLMINRNLNEKLYLHRSCRPITQVEWKHEKQLGFAMECEGGCGL
jgi:hypothetical protein